MFGSEFEKYFEHFLHFRKKFLGVFSIDTLPKRIKTNHFCICNTSPSNTHGEHWFCILKINPNCVELFDSLGVDNKKEEFYRHKLPFKENFLTFNVTQFQSNESQNCGFFCVYFLFQRFHNLDLDFDEILEECFGRNYDLNDEKVVEFSKELLES
jgi:hypothetical protein